MTPLHVVLLVILGVCIGASGFFSGSETAIVALPRERVHQLSGSGTRGRHLADLISDTERTLGTLLVANNFVNILGASVATTLAIDLITSMSNQQRAEALGPWLSTLAVTAVILVIGEITPKTLAARHPERWALTVAPTIWWLARVIEPVVKVFVGLTRGILRAFRIRAEPRAVATEEDIMALALLGEQAGHIDPSEREILEALFEVADRPVREVMTPRLEVVALEAGMDEASARQAVASHGRSRFPVVTPGGTLDDVVGILNVKDILRNPGGTGTIDRYLRQPGFVPESTPILSTLQQLRRQRQSVGLVVDEHGGVEGIVTVKDLIAELVGDIQDEYDPAEPSLRKLGDRVWMVEGRVPIEDLEGELGTDLPDGPFSSVGGLFLWAAGRIPIVGDRTDVAGYRLTVMRMDRRRIDRIRVESLTEPSTEAVV